MTRIHELMQSALDCTPDITVSVPGRVNLIGEHIDYNGGTVLPAALERQIHVGLSLQTKPEVTLISSRFERMVHRPLADPKRGDWTDYAMGALNKAAELGWLSQGVRLCIDSDLPDGAGVSSSAALITAILRAASHQTGNETDPVSIAQYARAVENDYIGVPCGIMDQMAVSLARPGQALALNSADLTYQTLTIPADWTFITLHTGIRRDLSDGRYETRFRECAAARQELNAEHLCLLDESQKRAADKLPDPIRKRVRHVVDEHQRTLSAIEAMKKGDLKLFGQVMRMSHISYSKLFEASLPQIDEMADAALTDGAVGARLTGGGFGGCLVVLLHSTQAEDWMKAFKKRYRDILRV